MCSATSGRPRDCIEVETGALLVHADYESFDDLFEPFTTGTGHSGTCYGSLKSAQQRQLREEAHRRVGAPSEPFRLPAQAWSVRGRVPRVSTTSGAVVFPSGRAAFSR
jgi:hypothetical protein